MAIICLAMPLLPPHHHKPHIIIIAVIYTLHGLCGLFKVRWRTPRGRNPTAVGHCVFRPMHSPSFFSSSASSCAIPDVTWLRPPDRARDSGHCAVRIDIRKNTSTGKTSQGAPTTQCLQNAAACLSVSFKYAYKSWVLRTHLCTIELLRLLIYCTVS